MRWGFVSLVSCVLSVGCATQANKGPLYGGDPHGRATMEVLPSLDVIDDALTPEMRMARLLCAESLALLSPPVPSDTSATQLTDWSEHQLKSWLGEKLRRAEAARQELDKAALQSHRQRILAGALLGLVFEDVARELLSLPAPRELEREPEVAVIFREVMMSQATPYLMHAGLAYRACAGNATGLRTMDHWSGFCSERAEGLPQRGPGFEEGDTTTVTVERTTAAR